MSTSNELSTTITSKEWWKDPKNKVTAFVIAAMSAYPVYLLGKHVIPFLLNMVWDTTALLWGTAILGASLWILTNKKLWRAIKYLGEFVGKYTLGLVIELNPFNILELQIEEAIKDREKVKAKGNTVSAKKIELEQKIAEKTKYLTSAKNRVKVCTDAVNAAIRAGKRDEAELHAGDLELETTKVASARDYIESLTPIVQDLGFLENYCKKVYKLSGTKIEKSKVELEIGRDKYESVMSGAGVAKAAWRALAGDDNLNRDAELALVSIQRKVSSSLAEMKNTMELTSDIIRSIEKENTVRAREGIEIIRTMELEGVDEYKAISASNWDSDLQFTNTQSSYANLLLNEVTGNKYEEVKALEMELPKTKKN